MAWAHRSGRCEVFHACSESASASVRSLGHPFPQPWQVKLWLCQPSWVKIHFSLDVHMYIHTWDPAWGGFGTSNGTGSENSCHLRNFAMDVTDPFGEKQNQAPVPFKSPWDVKFCCAILSNGHMTSIFNSRYLHFRDVAFSSISFHHSKELIKNLVLQLSRLRQFRFYLLKNNHLSATEKEEKNLPPKIWRSASL